MTPRHEMALIDLEDEPEEIRKRLETSDYAHLVVCRGGMEQVVGIMQAKDLLKKIVDGHAPADYVDVHGWRFEVMDMEKNRVDKVLVSKN